MQALELAADLRQAKRDRRRCVQGGLLGEGTAVIEEAVQARLVLGEPRRQVKVLLEHLQVVEEDPPGSARAPMLRRLTLKAQAQYVVDDLEDGGVIVLVAKGQGAQQAVVAVDDALGVSEQRQLAPLPHIGHLRDQRAGETEPELAEWGIVPQPALARNTQHGREGHLRTLHGDDPDNGSLLGS